MTKIVLQGHFDAADRARNPFPLLPFKVEPGVTQLQVHYWVSQHLSAGNLKSRTVLL